MICYQFYLMVWSPILLCFISYSWVFFQFRSIKRKFFNSSKPKKWHHRPQRLKRSRRRQRQAPLSRRLPKVSFTLHDKLVTYIHNNFRQECRGKGRRRQEEGGQGRKDHTQQEGANIGPLLPSKDAEACPFAQIPAKVHSQSNQVGRILRDQAPADHRVCHEKDWRHKHAGLHRGYQGEQAPDSSGRKEAV